MTIGRFLGGIAALIWNPVSEKYLLLRRSDQRDFQAGAWECVTGRVNQGESFEQALYREVLEETGAVVQIEFLVATTHFYRGHPIPENELLGVIYSCTIQEPAAIHFGDEHSEQQWLTRAEIEKLLPNSHWLRKIIHKAERLRSCVPEDLRQEFRQQGFEI